MSESDLVDCPHCGELVEGGAACAECGGDISGMVPASIEAAAEANTLRASQSVADTSEQRVSKSNAISEKIRSEEGQEDSSFTLEGGCPLFSLEFNEARICVQGWMTSFNFRVLAKSAESSRCQMLKVEVRIEGEKPIQKTVLGSLLEGRGQTVDFNFTSQCLGYEIFSEVRLTYQLDGANYTYAGGFKWDAVSPETSSAKVIENLVIKMDGVEAGMAADQNINILQGFKARESRSMLESMQEFKSLRPVWKCIELHHIDEMHTEAPNGLCDRLSLLGPDGMRVHLIGGTRFSMGRAANRACDITTLLFCGSDQPDPQLSSRSGISRFQAHLVYRGGLWELRDGGIDPSASFAKVKPSTYGTYLNGQKMALHAEVLQPNSEKVVTFARRPNQDKYVFGFEVTSLRDPSSGQTGGLLLERMDSVPECFLCIAEQIDLDELMPNSEAGTLTFQNGGFRLKQSSGDRWLIPETTINHKWICADYRQLGL